MNYYINILPGDINKNSPHKFDENGVILSKIPYTPDYDYHATSIASYAIQNMDKDKISTPQINWLENNMEEDGSFFHRFKLPFYDFKLPWIGGLSQGLAISVFIRACHKTQEKKYLKLAIKSFNSLKKNCLFTDSSGHTWIEEYPGIPSILNEFIYSLFGVIDICKNTKLKSAEKLRNDCIATLLGNLYDFDMGYWSRYDLVNKFPATTFYHKIHIEQMYALYYEMGHGRFYKYYLKWKMQLANARRANLKRNFMLIKHHGILGSYKRYKQRKRWLNE